MVPTSVILSPESYEKVVAEILKSPKGHNPDNSKAENQLALPPLSVRSEDTDIVVVKELVPNPCPICHHQLKFLREMIERFEREGSNIIRCPLGHRYSGMMKVYHLNIIRESESEDMNDITECPSCNSNRIQCLGPSEMFCLDCDWDSGW
ncbi:hypothetical protein C6497_13690 [Candidatus Poribacteria bacterium]|nr:MAG: hypothetical protein C6497_13690 [Candidatus Poribacteria bacterium]